MSRTTVVIPEELRDAAKELGVNISEVCRYALDGAVAAARRARKLGASDYEYVRFPLYVNDSEAMDVEWVQFLGREVHYSETDDEAWYITPKSSIVKLVKYQDKSWPLEENEFEVFENLTDLRAELQSRDDDAFGSLVLQAFEAHLGQPVTPRILDI